MHVAGLVVLERNYLEVYTYDKWQGNHIPHFIQGDQFEPTTILMNKGRTEPPNLLTESDLISMMEKNEIGKLRMVVGIYAYLK